MAALIWSLCSGSNIQLSDGQKEIVQQCLPGLANVVDSDSDDGAPKPEGQDHVFTFVDDVEEQEQHNLDEQMEDVDPDALETTFLTAVSKLNERDVHKFSQPALLCWQLKRPPKPGPGANVTLSGEVRENIRERWRRNGLKLLSHGCTAMILIASSGDDSGLLRPDGARGGRPMALMDLGLPSKKTIFELYCDRLRRLKHMCERSGLAKEAQLKNQRVKDVREMWARKEGRADKSDSAHIEFPLYIMLNRENEADVRKFFQERDHFGLPKSSVYFFVQDYVPLLDQHGKILLETKGSVWTLPDGSGGLFAALRRCGVLADMKCRGVTGAFIMGCCNLLAKIADPLFLGHSTEFRSEACVKCVERLTELEPIRLLLNHVKIEYKDIDNDGDLDEVKELVPAIIPHYEFHEDVRRQRDHHHRLLFSTGDLGQYFFSVDVLQRMCDVSGYGNRHALRLRVPYVSLKSGRVKEPPPGENNAICLETLISDGLETIQGSVLALLVDRTAEMALVREPDDAIPAVFVLSLLHQSWLLQAGGKFYNSVTAGLGKDVRCEVSPLISYEGEDLQGVGLTCQSHHVFGARMFDLPLNLLADGEKEIAAAAKLDDDLEQRQRNNAVKYVPDDDIIHSMLAVTSLPPEDTVIRFANAAGLTDTGTAFQDCNDIERLPDTPKWLREEAENAHAEMMAHNHDGKGGADGNAEGKGRKSKGGRKSVKHNKPEKD